MRSNLSTILLIMFSGIIFFLLIILAISLLLVGSLEKFTWSFQNISIDQPLFQALSLIIIATLVLPMGYFNIRHLLGRTDAPSKPRNLSGWSISFLTVTWFLIVLYIDKIDTIGGGWSWLANLTFSLFSIGLPILIILGLSLRGIPLGSKRLSWSIFGLGLVLGPILILISEITILIVLLFVGMIFFAKNPIFNHEIMAFFNQLISSYSGDGFHEFVFPYLSNPWIIASIVAFISLIVPLVEEFLKPAGTWLVVNKNMTPREGFALGILSGAGYALFESLSAAGNMGNGQSMVLLGRAGTDLLHIFNTGIVGWAMISDWKLKGWFKLIVVFLLSILIHGLWNGLALTLGLSTYFKYINIDYNWLGTVEIGGVIGLITLALLMTIGLWAINHKLRDAAIEKNN